jgi:hypothetical protein
MWKRIAKLDDLPQEVFAFAIRQLPRLWKRHGFGAAVLA